jgi:hypothetical protein
LDRISKDDNIGSEPEQECSSAEDAVDEYEMTHDQDSEEMRFRQIYDMINQVGTQGFDNAPNEVVTDIDTVTTRAGGGMNGRKHADDIRVKDHRQGG